MDGVLCLLLSAGYFGRDEMDGREFADSTKSNESLLTQASSFSSCVADARRNLNGVNLAGQRVVDRQACWVPPMRGWFKMNTPTVPSHLASE